jgi:hypothetical protein
MRPGTADPIAGELHVWNVGEKPGRHLGNTQTSSPRRAAIDGDLAVLCEMASHVLRRARVPGRGVRLCELLDVPWVERHRLILVLSVSPAWDGGHAAPVRAERCIALSGHNDVAGDDQVKRLGFQDQSDGRISARRALIILVGPADPARGC